jgi:hypothetical protein
MTDRTHATLGVGMRFRGRAGWLLLTLLVVGSLGLLIHQPFALASARADVPQPKTSLGSSEREVGDGGEIWVSSQGTHRLFVLHGREGRGGIETMMLPDGTGPHLINFSSDGEYIYVSGMGNGNLVVIRADDRKVVATLNLGSAGTHQAMPSPRGDSLFVTQIPTKRVVKVMTGTWTATQELTLARSPICTIFRDDGRRAYVSLLGGGIAIIDVLTMTQIGEIATDGFVACGMVKERDGRGIMLASDDGGGHVYRLDLTSETLDDRGTLGAVDWHSFRMSPNEKLGFGSVPRGDEIRIIDLETDPVESEPLPLDPTPGLSNDEPDHLAVRGNTIYAPLRESGKLAIVDVNQRRVKFIDLSLLNAGFNPMTCAGCPLHGVAVRPDTDAPKSRIATPRVSQRMEAARFRIARGTASDITSSIASVELALSRKRGAACKWWSGPSRRTITRPCSRPVWFRAAGQKRWLYRFARTLPRGEYQLRSRARDSEGNRERARRSGRNSVRFQLR